MKICYIFREKERKAHSIELLFDTISSEVENSGIEIEKWYKPLSNLKAIFAVRKLKADIYHVTGDCYFLSLFLPWKKTMMTVHDIGMYKNHPKTLKRRVFAFVSFVLPMKFLKISTAISDLSKQDLVQILGINPYKVVVIPNPLVLPLEHSCYTFNNERPVILQIGTGDHKNLIGLIKAVKGMSCFLDIVGRPSEYLIKLMDTYRISYNITSDISIEDIKKKYHECDIVYFASFSEGFGLPILEAQTVGRPIITSDMEPMRSIAGSGSILVNPADHEQIRKAIEIIINNSLQREQTVQKGLENVKKYELKDIVKKYIEVYNKLL